MNFIFNLEIAAICPWSLNIIMDRVTNLDMQLASNLPQIEPGFSCNMSFTFRIMLKFAGKFAQVFHSLATKRKLKQVAVCFLW